MGDLSNRMTGRLGGGTNDCLGSEPKSSTAALHFSELSERAQELIVNAVLGALDGPPKMSDSVRDEIRAWAWGPECDPKNSTKMVE